MTELFTVDESNIPDISAESSDVTPDIAQPLDEPELSSPDDLTNYPSTRVATLEWESVSGASEYEVEVSKSSSFETWKTKVYRTSGLSQETETLEEDETYHWRVRAVASKVSSPWSDVWQFSTKKEKGKRGTQDVRSPKIDSLSVSDGVIDPSTEDNNSETTITIDYDTSKGDAATGARWKCWTWKKLNGEAVAAGEQIDCADANGLLGDLLVGDKNGTSSIIFRAPLDTVFADSVNYWTFYVSVRVRNQAGSSYEKTTVTVRRKNTRGFSLIASGALEAENNVANVFIRKRMIMDKIDVSVKTPGSSGTTSITLKKRNSPTDSGTSMGTASIAGSNTESKGNEPSDRVIPAGVYMGFDLNSVAVGSEDLRIDVSGV